MFFFVEFIYNRLFNQFYTIYSPIWFLNTFFFKERSNKLFFDKLENFALRTITNPVNHSFLFSTKHFQVVGGGNPKKYYRENLINFYAFHKGWFWSFIFKLYGLNSTFLKYKQSFKNLFYFNYIKRYPSTKMYSYIMSYLSKSRQEFSDLFNMIVKKSVPYYKSIRFFNLYFYTPYQKELSIIDLVNSDQLESFENESLFLINILLFSRWYISSFLRLGKKSLIFNKETGDKFFTFYGSQWYKNFNLFLNYSIPSVLFFQPHYSDFKKSEARKLLDNKPHLYYYPSIEKSHFKSIIKRLSWKISTLNSFINLKFFNFSFPLFVKKTFFKIRKEKYKKALRPGEEFKINDYVFNGVCRYKKNEVHNTHYYNFSKFFFKFFISKFVFHGDKFAIYIKNFLIKISKIMQSTKYIKSLKIKKIINLWSLLYYEKNLYSLIVAPYLVSYKEINFKIKVSSILKNILNDRYYLQPDWSKSQFKLLINGLFRHF